LFRLVRVARGAGEPVRRALDELARRAPYLKLLGSYPMAVY